MRVIVACKNPFLGRMISSVLNQAGFNRVIRTGKLERLESELKSPNRLAIVDMEWQEAQSLHALKKLVNIGNISGNKLACICPDRDEELKKIARASRAAEVFIRYEVQRRFVEWLNAVSLSRANQQYLEYQ